MDYELHGLIVNSVRHDPSKSPEEALKPAKGNLVFSSRSSPNAGVRPSVVSHEFTPVEALSAQKVASIISLWHDKYSSCTLVPKKTK